MKQLKNFGEFESLRQELKVKEAENEKKVRIYIAMATCSIASGSAKVLEYFKEEMPKQPVEFVIKPTGCLGLCHSEPTVEVVLPGSGPVVFGKVDTKRAKLIIDEYIKNGKLIDGVIEEN